MNSTYTDYIYTEEKIVEYLKTNGYPENRISTNWGKPNCAIDIAIFDDTNSLPIVIFEVKGAKNQRSVESGILSLKRAVRMFDISTTATCYLAFPMEREPYFEVHNVSQIVYGEDKLDVMSLLHAPKDKLPSYNTANAGSAGKILKQKNDRKKKKIDRLRITCYILVGIGMAIAALDYFKLYELSSLRLILFGAMVLLLLIPSFSEITIKEFSLKRMNEDKEGKQDD